MNPIQIQSNSYRDDYLKNIVSRTIKEINSTISTVFGPFAVDAYITKEKQPYYTKDGLEVLRSLRFDNELSMYVLKILYQAVFDQGKKIGDGTTTLAVLYTHIYMNLIEQLKTENIELATFRPAWNLVIDKIITQIQNSSCDMKEDDLLCMLATCTQDDELTAKLYHNLKDAIMDNSYIVVSKSNIETDFATTVNREPLFKVTRQFTVKPIKQKEGLTVILHCNGLLDIAHIETFYGLLSRVHASEDDTPIPYTIILLCNGITEATRKTTKELVRNLSAMKSTDSFNNIAIYTLDGYRGFTPDELEDISTIITDEPGIGGLVNAISFESLLYQSYCIEDETIPAIEELQTFDCDIHHIDKMRELFDSPYSVEFDDVEGMRIRKPLGPVAQARYDTLRKDMEAEKSEVKKLEYKNRLRKIYGQFIEVEVGSRLIKDSQRKYELILDAIVSSMEGVRHGVLRVNSILLAARETALSLSDYTTSNETDHNIIIAHNILYQSLYHTFMDMLNNGGLYKNSPDRYTTTDFWKLVLDLDKIKRFDLSRTMVTEDSIYEPQEYLKEITIDEQTYQIHRPITEPTTIITNILKNSTLIIELALAKVIQLDSFMQNYI